MAKQTYMLIPPYLRSDDSIAVDASTTFEAWYEVWKGRDALRGTTRDHPIDIQALRDAWEAGTLMGLDINY